MGHKGDILRSGRAQLQNLPPLAQSLLQGARMDLLHVGVFAHTLCGGDASALSYQYPLRLNAEGAKSKLRSAHAHRHEEIAAPAPTRAEHATGDLIMPHGHAEIAFIEHDGR